MNKHYPIVTEDGNFAPVAPENTAIREETTRLINEFKTEKEYAMIFKSAYFLWKDKNCLEAYIRSHEAAKKLPKGWCPPYEVQLLVDLITEHKLPYNGKPRYINNCRYNKE